MSEAVYPEWPSPTFGTRDAAIAHAMADADPGDEITVHEAECAMRLNLPCSCEPEVRVVPPVVIS